MSRPFPVYEETDAEALTTFEEEDESDEDEENLKEVREIIARNEVRNERFRKLAGF